ncbi:hypothetical protein SDC9_82434 [bioreactor metagenome]|uniref:Uncharacterized protein n=1 Tax=bioreactor metagenome TaxID=1076179 RepID=A0A644Z4L8_9ZZZZ
MDGFLVVGACLILIAFLQCVHSQLTNDFDFVVIDFDQTFPKAEFLFFLTGLLITIRKQADSVLVFTLGEYFLT